MGDNTQWSDIIEKALEKLGGEAHLQDIYSTITSMPEGKAKINAIKVRGKKDPKDFKATIRCVIQKDSLFTRSEQRGYWKLTSKKGSKKAEAVVEAEDAKPWNPRGATDKRVKGVLAEGPKAEEPAQAPENKRSKAVLEEQAEATKTPAERVKKPDNKRSKAVLQEQSETPKPQATLPLDEPEAEAEESEDEEE
jgi:hypothetical protein